MDILTIVIYGLIVFFVVDLVLSVFKGLKLRKQKKADKQNEEQENNE